MMSEIEQAINLLHSAEFWYKKYEDNLAMRENGHARTVKALQIIAFSEDLTNE